ncbi:toll/interleukin-1 receptor domain-containing protein [Reticulibacter mediterranei]|nr:toll/interleukin-1 receptor domain-containing protein [Reticulibacter mediterranei]
MANKEHVKIIRQGIAVWNEWRKKYPEVRPDLRDENFNGADFNGADFNRARLNGARLNDTTLRGAWLNDANMSSVNLRRADLRRADLRRADFSEASFSGAWFDDADLSDANLSGVMLSDANLSNTNLFGANLSSAHLFGAKFTNARTGWTIFSNIDLHSVKELESVKHEGPSTIGIDTLIRSNGDIPPSFLKGAGVPDELIEYARSLIGRAIEYYTCFISYSSLDQNFAERLYADLQNKGVRCWFAPHDMKIGDKIRTRIDESIRIYDKLLLVLSEHSVNAFGQ